MLCASYALGIAKSHTSALHWEAGVHCNFSFSRVHLDNCKFAWKCSASIATTAASRVESTHPTPWWMATGILSLFSGTLSAMPAEQQETLTAAGRRCWGWVWSVSQLESWSANPFRRTTGVKWLRKSEDQSLMKRTANLGLSLQPHLQCAPFMWTISYLAQSPPPSLSGHLPLLHRLLILSCFRHRPPRRLSLAAPVASGKERLKKQGWGRRMRTVDICIRMTWTRIWRGSCASSAPTFKLEAWELRAFENCALNVWIIIMRPCSLQLKHFPFLCCVLNISLQ